MGSYNCKECGRSTTKKKHLGDTLKNHFFICYNCRGLLCGECMIRRTGMPNLKLKKLGKKGRAICPDCGQTVSLAKLPTYINFATKECSSDPSSMQQQSQSQKVNIEITGEGLAGMKYCRSCNKRIKESATFCEHCGATQNR